jgi:hypothetical protein
MVLLELMIALFVFTVVAFSLVMALDSAMTAGRERNEIAIVTRGLNNQLTLLHSGLVAPEDKDISDDGSGVSYHVTIEPEQLKDQKGQPLPSLFRATVTAKWKSGTDSEERDLNELIYQP